MRPQTVLGPPVAGRAQRRRPDQHRVQHVREGVLGGVVLRRGAGCAVERAGLDELEPAGVLAVRVDVWDYEAHFLFWVWGWGGEGVVWGERGLGDGG